MTFRARLSWLRSFLINGSIPLQICPERWSQKIHRCTEINTNELLLDREISRQLRTTERMGQASTAYARQ